MGKMWKCDLVNARGDTFWELGNLQAPGGIGEFPGDKKETNFVVKG